MCIICNTNGAECADKFLEEFSAASSAMERAAKQMLECSRIAPDPATKRRYDAAHKGMVRIMKAWRNIEHTREGA